MDAIQTNDNQTKSGVIDLFVESLKNPAVQGIDAQSVLTAMRAVFAAIESSKQGAGGENERNLIEEGRGMKRIIAVNSNCYHGYTIEEAVAGIRKAGFRYIELTATKGWTDMFFRICPL